MKPATLPLDESIRTYISIQGWSPGRIIDQSKWIRDFDAAGWHPVFPIAENILATLGGLYIQPKTGEGCQYASSPITFDPSLEESAELDDIKYWEDKFGFQSYPIGMTDDEIRLVVTDSGEILGVFSDMLFSYGTTLNDSFHCLVLADRVPKTLA